MKKFIGYLMLLFPFIIIYVFGVLRIGILKMSLIYLAVGLLLGFILLALYLIDTKSKS